MSIVIHKGGVTVNVAFTPSVDNAALAALEKLVADTADQMIQQLTDAANRIVSEVKAAGDRVSTDVTELQRRIDAAGLSDQQKAAIQSSIDNLNATGEQLKAIDPLPEFPPTEPTA